MHHSMESIAQAVVKNASLYPSLHAFLQVQSDLISEDIRIVLLDTYEAVIDTLTTPEEIGMLTRVIQSAYISGALQD